MERKVLYMEYPMITSYPTHANLLSCQLQYKQSLEWYFEHYFNLVSKKIPTEFCSIDFFIPMPWKVSPYIESQNINRKTVDSNSINIINFIINAIDDDNYIFLYLDRFYLKASSGYQKWHNPHDVFIYGYDKEKRVLCIADFFKDIYEYTTASFDEIEKAYYEADLSSDYFKITCVRGILLIKPVDIRWRKYNVERTLVSLNDFLNMTTSYDDNCNSQVYTFYSSANQDFEFGIGVYDYLSRYLQNCIENANFCDIRGLHVIYDHMQFYQLYLEFISKRISITDEKLKQCELMKLLSLEARNLALKYNLTKNNSLLERVILKVNILKEKDKEFISALIDFLYNNKQLL